MRRSFREALRGTLKGKALVGTLITTPSPEVAEVVARCGLDWIFVDGEHGSVEGSAVGDVLRAVETGSEGQCFGVVRVPEISAVWFKKALDAGADGVIVPLVKTPEEAWQAVMWTKYPPMGQRSIGIGRAQGYGLGFSKYVATANESVALIIQIEHIRAVENLEAILAVPGIDAILIGMYDLSGSLGVPGNVEDERVQAAVKKVRERCKEKGMPVGTFVLEPAAGLRVVEAGCGFVAVGTDMVFVAAGARAVVEGMKPGAQNP